MIYPYVHFYGLGDSWILIALIAVLLLGLFAQMGVNKAFRKYSRLPAASGVRAYMAAQQMLRSRGSFAVVQPVSGRLTDHFNPKTNTVGLSDEVHDFSSVAALAIAAHEVGHVMQYENEYAPIRIRNAILPVANFGSRIAPFVVILGLIMESFGLAMAGVVLFGVMLLFQLVTLPVEFNASARALEMLETDGYVSREQIPYAKKVLRAAAFTYVVAALSILVQMLRLLFIAQRTRRR